MTRMKNRLPAPALPIEDDERHGNDIDAFIARNREVLSVSLRRARREVAEGKTSAKNIDTVIAEGRSRHSKKK
jgi:hypothetical protein